MNFSPIRDYVYRVFKVCIQAFLLFCTTVLVNTGLLWAIRIFKLTYFETMPIRLLHKTYFPGNIGPKPGTGRHGGMRYGKFSDIMADKSGRH